MWLVKYLLFFGVGIIKSNQGKIIQDSDKDKTRLPQYERLDERIGNHVRDYDREDMLRFLRHMARALRKFKK